MQTRRTFLQAAGVAGVLGTVGVGAASARPPSEGQTIAAIAGVSQDFEVLFAAVGEAGLAGLLGGNRQLTVFAPLDSVFEGAGVTAENVDTFDFEGTFGFTLAEILAYHVVPGRRAAQSVLPVSGVPTLYGARVAVDGTTLNDGQATIVAPDAAAASNGIVHAIDGLLLPPN